MADYIRKLRTKVGHDYVILNFSGGCVFNEVGEVLLQKEGIMVHGDFLAGQWKLENRLKKLQFEK